MAQPDFDDLMTLNQEIAAFVKAGIPIELGLKGMSGSVRTRLGKLATRLESRLASGRTLSEALAEEGPAVSPVYTAVVEAGLASGRLAEALQSLTESSQVLQELRRRVMLAAVYPIICLLFGYGMFCLFITVIAAHLLASMESLTKGWSVELLRFLHQNSAYFTMVIPAAVLACIVVAAILRETVARGLWQRITSLRWVAGRSLNCAQFTEILTLQVEHGAPLPRSFVLAANATNSNRLRRQALEVYADLNNGRSLAESIQSMRSLPPLVRWMIASSGKQGTLAVTLRQLSEMYRRQALRRAAILKVWFPVLMTIIFTGAIGLTYGLAFFLPLRSFLMGLMQE